MKLDTVYSWIRSLRIGVSYGYPFHSLRHNDSTCPFRPKAFKSLLGSVICGIKLSYHTKYNYTIHDNTL
jgi:hypothetical protein